jgi:phosphoesterase RecJ-like protein
MQQAVASNAPQEVADYLRELDKVAISTHVGADGDAIGSSVAMFYLMRSLGADVVICHREPVPGYLSWLPPDEVLTEIPDDGRTLLAMDTSRQDRVGVDHEHVGLNLDHHEDNPLYGDYNLVNANAAGSAEVVASLYPLLGVEIERKAAEAIYTGVYTDTGGFRFRNTSPAMHEMVAELLRAGVVPAEVDDRINRTGTIQQVKIVGLSMANAVRYGEALISTVDNDDYERAGATELDSKESIDSLRKVQGVELVAHLRQVPEGTKGSLRSESVDVAEIARTFGGGGHRLAAGYTTPKTPAEAREELLGKLAGVVDLDGEGSR